MNAELKTKWVEALRSGTFKQTQGVLKDNFTNTYCCLGVLCEVGGITIPRGSNALIYVELRELIAGPDFEEDNEVLKITDKLVQLNDSDHASFAEIADFIDANVPVDTAVAT